MNKTLRISFALRITYKVNSIIFALKSLPIINKLLPASLYASRGLKGFALVIAWIVEFFSVFLGKGLYLFSMVFPLLGTFSVPQNVGFVHCFTFLTIVGGFMNTQAFNPTKDKYYAIFLMRMDAREYSLVNYVYFIAKMFVGFMPFTIIIGYLTKTPLWICLLMPLFVCSVKLIFMAVIIHNQDSDKNVYNENMPTKIVWGGVLLFLAAAYVPLYFGYAMPIWLFPALCIPSAALAVFCSVKIWRFQDYRRIYKKLLDPTSPVFAGTKSASQAATVDMYQKKLDTDITITSSASGYKYFNEIFMRRHSKLLTRSAKRTTLILLCIVLMGIGACFVFPDIRPGLSELVLENLPIFLFVMYFTNRGSVITQAMFINCDHSMLTYRFYRQPRAILSLFKERLKYVSAINLLPALPLALGLPALLYVTGGTSRWWDYPLVGLAILAASVFFSVHHMVLYYLLQPYNLEAERKSATFGIVNWATYVVCYAVMMQDIPTSIFAPALTAFCLIYIVAALVLAYKLAPRTFKLR